MRIRPSRDEFRALARDFTVVPVWAELLADLETPVAAYAKLVGDAPGFLLESVEHGERWSRFSFVGRDPVATLVLRDGRVDVEGSLPVDVPRDRGILAALEHLLDVYRAPVIPELPPLHGGLMGYLGYDVIREVERLPDVPPDDRHLPDAVMSMIGSLAAFDHWRQRVTLIESVPVLGDVDVDAAYDAAVASIGRAVANLARPLPYVPVEPRRPPTRCCPTSRARCPTVCTSRRSRSPRSTSSPATSSRSCSPSATTCSSTPTRSTCTGSCARSTRARTCTSSAIPS